MTNDNATNATCGASSAPGCAADMFETTSALIGNVTEVENGWEVAFAPDCTTWITVRRDEHDEPKVGDFITVTVPKAVAIHSQPNPSHHAEPRFGGDSVDGVVLPSESENQRERK